MFAFDVNFDAVYALRMCRLHGVRLPYVLYATCLFVMLVLSHFRFVDRILFLILPVPGDCLLITFSIYFMCDPHHLSSGFPNSPTQTGLYYTENG